MKNSPELFTENMMKEYTELDHLLYKICFHGAATLSKLKPASLICFRNNATMKYKDVWQEYRAYVGDILPFSYKEVKICDKGTNVLFYREEWVERVINRKDVRDFLTTKGYKKYSTVEEALEILASRCEEGCPDEIGVFLGYPLSDVIAFSSKDKNKSIGVGYWRVYSNLDRANRTFTLYDQARDKIIDTLKEGVKPSQYLYNIAIAS